MEKRKMYMTIVLTMLFTVCLLMIIGGIFFININKNKMITVEAVVKYAGDDYIIVEDDKGVEYKLKDSNSSSYTEGDVLDLEVGNVNDKISPKEGEIRNVRVVNKNISFAIEDEKSSTNDEGNNTVNSNNESDNVYNNNSNGNTSNNSNRVDNSTNYTEDDVVSYFSELNSSLDGSKSDKTISQSLKDGFVTVVDFLFYDKAIKGKTFKELSTSAKLKVLKLALSIDAKIDSYFPDYKQSLASNYQNVKSRVVAKYLDITSEVCEKNEDTCEAAKKGLSDMKQSFSLTWSFIKDIAGVGAGKLSSWYKVWKNS